MTQSQHDLMREASDRILADIRTVADFCGCRIEVSSDREGSLGKFCCTASNGDREKQGFGGTIEEAVRNLRAQPVRGSTGKKN